MTRSKQDRKDHKDRMEVEMRALALQKAMDLAGNGTGASTTFVVSSAKVFYGFLRGRK